MRSQDLSPAMLRARVAIRQAQAHLDALDGDPVKRAWAEVMDALRDGIMLEDKAEALYNEEARRQGRTIFAPAVPFSGVSPVTREHWLSKARLCASAPLA